MFGAFKKLKDGLTKTRDAIFGKIAEVVGLRNLDDALIADIEKTLLSADIGVSATNRLISAVRERARRENTLSGPEVMNILSAEIRAILTGASDGGLWESTEKPLVFLIVGVNGAGKTTTVGKLARLYREQGKKVMIAACDTFRAAAVEQVEIWATRSGVSFMKSQTGADPAALAFDAATSAKAKGYDLLIVDTAGRLHTKSNLMQELSKIRRVIEKAAPLAPVKALLVIDGVSGQNAVNQAKVFSEAAGCDGIIVTKLDGTAKGGVVVAIAQEIKAPVRFVGLGEKIDDLEEFDPAGFADALTGGR